MKISKPDLGREYSSVLRNQVSSEYEIPIGSTLEGTTQPTDRSTNLNLP